MGILALSPGPGRAWAGSTVASPQGIMMAAPFTPHLDILPPAQRELWPLLGASSTLGFVLYGGTAIALRQGHRPSVDFDFFSESPLDKDALRDDVNITVATSGGTVESTALRAQRQRERLQRYLASQLARPTSHVHGAAARVHAPGCAQPFLVPLALAHHICLAASRNDPVLPLLCKSGVQVRATCAIARNGRDLLSSVRTDREAASVA